MIQEFAIILACDELGGIGYQNRLPWSIPEDMQYFKHITTSAPQHSVNAVIMGKNTWLSLPKSYRPLKDRLNIVVSSSLELEDEGVVVVSSIDSAIQHACNIPNIHKVFVIGGRQLYNDAIRHNMFTKAYITHVNKVASPIMCDIHIDMYLFNNEFALDEDGELKEYGSYTYKFCKYTKIKI